jgi:hypothetical protein
MHKNVDDKLLFRNQHLAGRDFRAVSSFRPNAAVFHEAIEKKACDGAGSRTIRANGSATSAPF